MLSRCLADYVKEMVLSARRTYSAIIFPLSINHVVLFFHFVLVVVVVALTA